MKVHKVQFISIFIMAFLALFLYAGIGAEWHGYRVETDDYYKECKLENLWLSGISFTKEDVDQMKEIRGVKDADIRQNIDVVASLKGNPKLTTYIADEYTVSTCKVVKGEKFTNETAGIWLDNQFAKKRKIDVGDTIELKMDQVNLSLEVKGIVMNPEMVYFAGADEVVPNHYKAGFAYVSRASLPTEFPLTYNEMSIRTDDSSTKTMEKRIDKVFEGKYSVLTDRKKQSSYETFDEEIEQHKTMAAVFPIAFILISLLIILTTMTRIVNNQRTQIGTLKALGYKKRKIMWHYVSYGFVLSLAGAVLGAAAGPFVVPGLLYPSMKQLYTIPAWNPNMDPMTYAIIAVTVIVATGVSYIACHNILKEIPAKILRPKPPKATKRGFFERTKFWNRLSFGLQWNLRDIKKSKVRSLMAIVGIIGCMSLLICSFCCQDMFKDMTKWQYDEIAQYNTKLTLNTDSKNQDVSQLKDQYKADPIQESPVLLRYKNKKKTGHMTIIDGTKLLGWQDKSRDKITLPKNGAAISYKMADQLQVSVGDTIEWHLYEKQDFIKVKITKIYRNPIVQGIAMSKTQFEKLGEKFASTAMITKKKLNAKTKIEGVKRVETIKEMKDSFNTLMGGMTQMIGILIILASLLAIVVLYNLGVLSYTERELATLKVLGIKTKKLRGLLLGQSVVLSLVGVIPGAYVGILLMKAMMGSLGDNMDVIYRITLTNFIISFTITIGLTIITNVILSKRLKQIDMVSALKGVE